MPEGPGRDRADDEIVDGIERLARWNGHARGQRTLDRGPRGNGYGVVRPERRRPADRRAAATGTEGGRLTLGLATAVVGGLLIVRHGGRVLDRTDLSPDLVGVAIGLALLWIGARTLGGGS